MKIIGQLFYPLFWGIGIAKLAVTAVSNRIFLETYVFYHSVRQTDKWREIETIEKAISALERKDCDEAKKTHLPAILKQGRQFVQNDVTAEMVLEALKTHRFSMRHIWSGPENNQTLIQYISDYITPPESPLRLKPPPRDLSGLQPRRLDFSPKLIILSDSIVDEIRRLLVGPDPLNHTTHPLLYFHTVRCKPALQDATHRQKLEGYVERAANLCEYVEDFAKTHAIDQKQLEDHIRDKKWKEFVALCLP